MIQFKYYSIIILMLGVLLFSCASNEKVENEKPLIVTTTGMIGDMAKVLAEDRMDVISLMGPGVDPHLYKASQGDLELLNKADIVLYNGLKLEGKMGDILEKLGRKKPVVAIAKQIDKSLLHGDPKYPNDDSANDPHIWFDVSLWRQTIPVVEKVLSEFDPENAANYALSATSYISKLTELHDWTADEIAKIPEENKILITSHDAFGYFGSAYDLEVDALQGISTVSEFGLKDISDLVTKIVDRNIPAIFVESSVSSKSLEAVVEGCKDRGHEVKIGGTLFSDAMGEEGTVEGTYLGMVWHNVNVIQRALNPDALNYRPL